MVGDEKIPHFDAGDAEEIELRIVGDLHIGDPACDYVMIMELIKWIKAKSNRYIVIAGDLFNAALRESVSDVYSEDMTLDAAMERFEKLFSPVSERVIAVVDGNHDRRVWKSVGIDPVKWACHKSGIPYYGNEANVCIKLGNHNPSGKDRVRKIHYLLYMTHGVGGGRLKGAKANSLSRLGDIIDADLYVQGHTHTPMCFPEIFRTHDSRYRRIVVKRRMFVSTGSCLDRAGYAKAFAYPALPKEWIVVKLMGNRKWIEATI